MTAGRVRGTKFAGKIRLDIENKALSVVPCEWKPGTWDTGTVRVTRFGPSTKRSYGISVKHKKDL